MAVVFIGLGSNIGQSTLEIKKALSLLNENHVKICKVASFIKTVPYGDVEQPDFVNTVCQAETDYFPTELLMVLKKIEKDMGRTEGIRWGPRIIDLDILLYDDLIFKSSSLRIPHSDMLNRSFVLAPLAEIAPEVIHPISGLTIEKHLDLFNLK
jgi:2-amino-4-hydroxy-6-hydroxymethyldihydropteridine pyrophosphokinase